MTSNNHIPDDEWDTVVRNMPVPTVDMVVRHPEGGFVLGKRDNKPAKDLWFVPGGRIHKGESFIEAVERISQEEIGASVSIAEQLGVYQHYYNTSDVGDGVPKHYVAVGFIVDLPPGEELSTDSQHSQLRVFEEPPKDTHYYTIQYLQDSNCLPS